jgi:hypothetical protein
VNATASIQYGPTHIDVYVTFEEDADRDAFIASAPKSVGLRASTISNPSEGTTKPLARFSVKFAADRVTGEINETGLRRTVRFGQVLAASAIPVTVRPPFCGESSLPAAAERLALLGL